MKKLLSLATALLMVASLAACGASPAGNSSASAASQSAQQSATSSSGSADIAPVLDVSTIAGKTVTEVESVLGAAKISEPGSLTLQDGTTTETVSNTYNDGTEISFISDIAARITVYPPDGSNIEDGAALIGLTPDQAGASSYNSVEDYSWSDNTEYFSISAFNNGDGTIAYIYVITSADYQ
ncbi:lipoprotein [uncultured Oscillibacter sp.]|uniref:LptM family lipoprotein n=1 Tax=uncultured Oscillibacter sp. TaxID=876091 RepID=UPI0025F3AE3A|nr:hypothetical protein [uncultured Oscillibacter sp.]